MAIDWPTVLDYAAVLIIAGLAAVGELVARYRDDPMRAVANKSGFVYVGVNALAAALALGIVRAYGWRFGVPAQDSARLTQVLASGFGSMTLFRSSLFHVRAGDQDVGIGPVAFLQVILAAADRAVDRVRAAERSKVIAELMGNVSFEKARLALTTFCFTLMQNVDAKDQAEVRAQVDTLAQAGFDGQKKALIWGLYLLNIVGKDALGAAVKALGSSIVTAGSVRVTDATVAMNEKVQLSFEVKDRAGTVLTDSRPAWTSSNNEFVTVDGNGVATGVKTGEATITATVDGEKGFAKVTVTKAFVL